jgi:hypothetical protein
MRRNETLVFRLPELKDADVRAATRVCNWSAFSLALRAYGSSLRRDPKYGGNDRRTHEDGDANKPPRVSDA